MKKYMDFEEPIKIIEEKIDIEMTKDNLKQVEKLKKSLKSLKNDIYSNLKPIDILKIARHIDRPHSIDYINALLDENSDFSINGDRHLSNDEAIICKFGTIDNNRVLIIGENKGKTLEEKKKVNFGMPHPEGYRKAMRAASIAEKFNIPIVTLVDTPGAFPGIEAEERGQSEAIAQSIYFFSGLTVPIISIVIGEGGSGGALAISVANKLAMLKYSVFSVISPEGCAAILWNDSNKTETAINNLKMTSSNLLEQKIIDDIIDEPLYGAHTDFKSTNINIKKYIIDNLLKFKNMTSEDIYEDRYKKLTSYGNYFLK